MGLPLLEIVVLDMMLGPITIVFGAVVALLIWMIIKYVLDILP